VLPLLAAMWDDHRAVSSPRASELVRLSGVALAVGGVSIAAFVLSHPWDRFVGAEVARTDQWRVAHTLHFVGAMFSLLGLYGLYASQRERLGRLGLAGFVIAFCGTAMFVGTGMLTAFVWPMLAEKAPGVIARHGAMFDQPALLALSITAITVSIGYVLFAFATLRAGVLPRDGIVLLAVGAVLGMAPPHPLGPMPWAGLVLGGVLYGLGGVRLGLALWSAAAADVSPA
jgi:hypothetical protein